VHNTKLRNSQQENSEKGRGRPRTVDPRLSRGFRDIQENLSQWETNPETRAGSRNKGNRSVGRPSVEPRRKVGKGGDGRGGPNAGRDQKGKEGRAGQA